MIPESSLCIHPGKAVWTIYIDAVCINYDGNAFDATLLAMVASLSNSQCEPPALMVTHYAPTITHPSWQHVCPKQPTTRKGIQRSAPDKRRSLWTFKTFQSPWPSGYSIRACISVEFVYQCLLVFLGPTLSQIRPRSKNPYWTRMLRSSCKETRPSLSLKVA